MGSGYKMASGSWEEFFAVHLPPTDFEDNRSLLKEFCERHDQYGNKIVLVTVSNTFKYIFFHPISIRFPHSTNFRTILIEQSRQ